MQIYERILMKNITEGKEFVDIKIHVKPRTKREHLVLEGDELVFYTTEPAEKGRANAALLYYLSRLLRIPTSRIEIVHGARKNTKIIRIYNTNAETIINKIRPLLG